jgi:hypothetical protein
MSAADAVAPDISDPAAPAATVAERAAAPATLPEIRAGGLTWRGARREDAPAILALLNDILADQNAPFRWAMDEVTETLAARYRDLDRDFLLGFEAPGGILRVYGEVHIPPGDETLIEHRRDDTTRSAPRGPEIHDRQAVVLFDLGFEISIGHRDHCRRCCHLYSSSGAAHWPLAQLTSLGR